MEWRTGNPNVLATLMITFCLFADVTYASPAALAAEHWPNLQIVWDERPSIRQQNPKIIESVVVPVSEIMQRIIGIRSVGSIRPSKPFSTNDESRNWERLGWGWGRR
ncbi:hypothetical protein Tcan_09579 [Toxocara canis]|uniref:Uncharacterized protein n=2 Tax=Toxocara canis TaxID=6265 RepID=A0A0B2VG84_TOXCA|nr:hypothetical protein Tcan_09579 [Toxocara canis]VDM26052.1 unnamed protein product [Toxocara canis]